MVAEPKPENKPPEVKLLVEIKPGRWGRTFHIFDLDNREIALHQKDAVKMAKMILRIMKEK